MWSCRKMGVVRGRTGEEWEGKGCGCDHGGCIGRSDGDGVMAMVSWQWCHGNGVMAMVSWQWCHGNGDDTGLRSHPLKSTVMRSYKSGWKGGGVAVGVVMDGNVVFIQLLSPSLPHKHSEDPITA